MDSMRETTAKIEDEGREGNDEDEDEIELVERPQTTLILTDVDEKQEDVEKEEFPTGTVTFSNSVIEADETRPHAVFSIFPDNKNEKNDSSFPHETRGKVKIKGDKINQERINWALTTAGQCSSGIDIVEVWVMNENRTALLRADQALWRDSSYQPPSHMNKEKCFAALQKLEDPTVEGYVPPEPKYPGSGIAGKLWVEKTTRSVGTLSSRKTMRSDDMDISNSSSNGSSPRSRRAYFKNFREWSNRDNGPSDRDAFRNRASIINTSMRRLSIIAGSKFNTDETFIWRDLKFLSEDPDNIPEPRINLFIEAGVGRVAGVPFDLPGSQGIVLFFAKSETNSFLLNDDRNVKFLRRSALLIGSVIALSEPTIDSLEAKEEREEMIKIDSFDIENDKSVGDIEVGDSKSMRSGNTVPMKRLDRCKEKMITLIHKLFSTRHGAKPPPPMPLSETFWTFFGAFMSMLVTSLTFDVIDLWSENKRYSIPLGPIGAFATLLFGLTAAPPTQPRNAIYGSAIAGCTGLSLSYLFPQDLLSLRISLAAGISIALMAQAGVTHPPGGALAVILTVGNHKWGTLILYLLASSIMILISVLINNLNAKRKYPQYWHMFPKCH